MARHLTIDDLGRIAVPEQPALSPDGAQVAYVVRTNDLDADRVVRTLWIVDVDGGEPRQLGAGPDDAGPAWSPDGTRLAYLGSTGEGPAQVRLLPPDGGEPTPLTDLPLGAGAPVWSPDGRALAFTAPVQPPDFDADAPVVAERLGYQADGEGLRRGRRNHLHLLRLDSGACVQLTAGEFDAAWPAFSPDGSRLAFSAAMDPDADLTRRREAYLIDPAATEPEPELVGSADGWAGPLSWSEDGSALLVAGTQGAPNAHYALLRVPLDGGATTDLSAPLDRSVMYGAPGYPGATPLPAGDGTDVLFCAGDKGCTHLYRVAEDGGEPRALVAGPGRNVSGLSVAAGRAAFVLGDSATLGEVATVDLASGEERVHTSHRDSLTGIEPFPRVERWFTIGDGTQVQGWLMRDPAAAGPQPLLLDIHGGPHNSWSASLDDWHLYHHELVARGWTVLLLNTRGSDGYGERFYTALLGGWGVNDARDFLDPVEELVAEGIADPERLAVTGYSYGGYMTCYLTSRDDRFAAAVTGGPISDPTSEAGTADNGQGLVVSEFDGLPWEDRERYAEMSPLTQVERVDTPTLILQGGDDVRCPVGQAQQWFTALRQRGVPTRLVLYPGASHVFIVNGRPSHRIDYGRRVVDWVERHAA